MTQNFGVYRKQGATEFVIDSGGLLNAASGKINLPTQLKRGVVPLNLFAGRVLASGENFHTFNVSATGAALPTGSIGGLIGGGTVPFLGTFTTNAKAAHVGWASGQTQALALPPVPIPPDFSSAGGLSIHAIAERSSDGASDNVLDFRFWADINASNKGTTGATMTTTPAEYSAAVSSAEAGAHPGSWNVHIVPGTHTNNAVRLFNAWIEYTRVTS
jgi:hypothetical protein